MPETKKLHYNKYLYKMQFRNSLAGIFRTEWQRKGNLTYAASKLNEYKTQLKTNTIITKTRWGNPEVVPIEDYQDANKLYRLLKQNKDYMIRCEYNTLNLYSNDLNMLKDISKKIASKCDIWEPKVENIDFLLTNANVILVDEKPELEYKVTFGRKRGKPELASWLRKNTDKSKAGKIFISNCEKNSFLQGQYIYAKDEKVILLLQMLVGDNIARIDKLVSKQNIDK